MRDLIMVLCAAAGGAFLAHLAHCYAWRMYREGKKEGQQWRIERESNIARGTRK